MYSVRTLGWQICDFCFIKSSYNSFEFWGSEIIRAAEEGKLWVREGDRV